MLSSLGLLALPSYAETASIYKESTGAYHTYQARQLNEVEGYYPVAENLELSSYGGWKAGGQFQATGFFRTQKIDGRWWVIDPEGYRYIHKAVTSVDLINGTTAQKAHEIVKSFGMNGLANWSDESIIDHALQAENKLAYCPKYSFISNYKKTRSDDLEIPVFDEEFESFCQEAAQYFAQYKNNPEVFGYFIDNELSWSYKGGLASHLAVGDTSDLNYQKAQSYLRSIGKNASNFTAEDEHNYSVLMIERYCSVVCNAIRAVDPNHMILGPRFNKSWLRPDEFYEVAGKYLDIIGLNHYHRWGSRHSELERIANASQRPLLFSEFYAMEKSPSLEEPGAGWKVKDQTSRASYYQHFLTENAAKPFMVGFHWFRFRDKDGENKGIVNEAGTPYPQLQKKIKEMNTLLYDYIDFVDNQDRSTMTLGADADSTYRRAYNFGSDPILQVKNASTNWDRRFCVRFDASDVPSDEEIISAKVQLSSVSLEEKLSGDYHATLVEDNDWNEATIKGNNAPAFSSTPLKSWSHGDDVEIDVTEELLDALDGDKKLTVGVYNTLRNGVMAEYASKEYPYASARPKLMIDFKPERKPIELTYDDFEEGLGNWTSSGFFAKLYTGGSRNSAQGDNSVQIRSGTGKSRLSNALDLSGFEEIYVDFSYITRGMQSGQQFLLQYSSDGGASYETVGAWVCKQDYTNGNFMQEQVVIKDVTFNENSVIRFRGDADTKKNRVYLDEIKISGLLKDGETYVPSWVPANGEVDLSAFIEANQD